MDFRRLFRQQSTGRSWGYLMQVASQTAIFVTAVNLVMLGATFYNTTLIVWLTERGLYISFWWFFAILVVFLAVIAVVLFKFAVPSYFSAFSDQFYKHDNPLKRDIEAIKKTQQIILEKLNDSNSNRDTSRDS